MSAPKSTEPMYLISESEIDVLCLTSIDIGVYNPGDFQHEVAREKRMRTLHNIFARGSAQQAPTERAENDCVIATKFGCDKCQDKNVCDKQKCFHFSNMPNKMIADMLSSKAAQERERLIDEFAKRFRSAYIFFDTVKFDETIQSLRGAP